MSSTSSAEVRTRDGLRGSVPALVRRLLLWATGPLLLILYAPTIQWLWGRWTLSVWHNAHGALVPPVVAYLAYTELQAPSMRKLPTQASAWGFAVLVPALLLLVADTGMHTELLAAVSLVLLLPGLSLLFLGVERTRAIAFPLAFMAFALPIPLSVTESLHSVLSHVAAASAAALVPFAGIPVFREGTTLHMARADLVVGDACSGFSTLYAAAAVACLTAWQAYGWKRRVLVVACAGPLAIAANVLRIVILVTIVAETGVDVLETWIHPASGMLTFALALPIIMWLGQSTPPTKADSARPASTTEPVPGPGETATGL